MSLDDVRQRDETYGQSPVNIERMWHYYTGTPTAGTTSALYGFRNLYDPSSQDLFSQWLGQGLRGAKTQGIPGSQIQPFGGFQFS